MFFRRVDMTDTFETKAVDRVALFGVTFALLALYAATADAARSGELYGTHVDSGGMPSTEGVEGVGHSVVLRRGLKEVCNYDATGDDQKQLSILACPKVWC